MTFYDDLSQAYDALFPVSASLRSLFGSLRENVPVRRAADAGCGSGSQLLCLAEEGVACIGFDPDPAMVELARKKLAPFPSSSAVQGGFADMRRIVTEPVDLLSCIGNSLVHVPRDAAVSFISDAAAVLREGGVLLIQILNYERAYRDAVTDLPLMTAGDGAAELRRRYVWESRDLVTFQTSLRLSGADGPVIKRNEIPLYPIYPDDLWNNLEEAGFESAFFGGFDRSGFSPDSEALVVIARRAAAH